MDVQNTTEMENTPLAKAVQKILFQIFRVIKIVFNVCNSNTNTLTNLIKKKSLSKANSVKFLNSESIPNDTGGENNTYW